MSSTLPSTALRPASEPLRTDRCWRHTRRGRPCSRGASVRRTSCSPGSPLGGVPVAGVGPKAVSPICWSSDSSIGVNPPTTLILPLRPYSAIWRMILSPFDPACPVYNPSRSGRLRDVGAVIGALVASTASARPFRPHLRIRAGSRRHFRDRRRNRRRWCDALELELLGVVGHRGSAARRSRRAA